jgi:hypothetical protein
LYIKRFAENFVQKALLVFEILGFEVYCRSDRDSPTPRYVTDTESRRLPDSPMLGVGESTKGKKNNILRSLCVPVVTGISGPAKPCLRYQKKEHFRFFSAVGYSAKNFLTL